jgi:antitoxin component of MazEF toxin-antitoxin module
MPHKQTRKIIRVGNSLAVTIPKPWSRYFGLSEKDEVIVLSNGAVIIKPVKAHNGETNNE